MSSVYDYSFNKTTRIRHDETDKSQDKIQNMIASNYMLDRFNPTSPASDHVDFATSQLNINFSGGYQTSQYGSNIDSSTMLLHSVLSKPKCKISLLERPYTTVPYLGRGKRNIAAETQILQGNIQTTRKSINPSSEVCYMDLQNMPMLHSLKSTISNPANLVEGVADKNWVRGGISSREYMYTSTK